MLDSTQKVEALSKGGTADLSGFVCYTTIAMLQIFRQNVQK